MIHLLAIQTQKYELSHIVSGDEHLSAHRHVNTAVPKTVKDNTPVSLMATHNDEIAKNDQEWLSNFYYLKIYV